MNATKVSCPNCCEPAIREGNVITCEKCDAAFTFKKTGGAKVKNIGRLDSLEERMQRVEGLLPEPADPEPADPEPADPEPADPEPADPEPADPDPGPESILGPE